MRTRRLLPLAFAACAAALLSQTVPDVGTGAISTTIKNEFVRSFFRNGFHLLVALPPVGEVRKLGATGLVQEFPGAASATARYALVKANTSDLVVEDVETVFQMYPEVFTYYSSVGSGTAGYPNSDTLRCGAGSSTCLYQLFDKNYALFTYTPTLDTGQNFSTRDPFFSRWRLIGGAASIGGAVNVEETVAAGGSGAGGTASATLQRFSAGALYNITGGAFSGRMFAVRQPAYGLYVSNGSHNGFLGLPSGDELILAGGRRRQNFEGGAIEYDPGGEAVLRLPVGAVIVNASAPKDRLNLGESLTLTASTFAANGGALEGRSVAWVTSNSRVIAVEPSGLSATLRAVGGGSAAITAVSEGKSSRPVTIFVIAPCCQVGEGSPTATIQQAFQDAVVRNRVSVRLPAPAPVRRMGNGFVQEFELAPPASGSLLAAKPDSTSNVYLIHGTILAAYRLLGGAEGPIGYPLGDATSTGRQLFQGGALAGSPVSLVSGAILTRWAAQNYERGGAGLPTDAAAPVLSFTATLASAQDFTGGMIAEHLTGPLRGQGFLVSGLVLERYRAAGGAAGILGLPVADEVSVSGRRRQEFEGGSVEYMTGAAEATLLERARLPRISSTPGAATPGSRVRVAAGGFATGATLRITVGGQPDFVVGTQTGAYAWELIVPAAAAPGLVILRAADVNSTAIAVGSYLVQPVAEALAQITKLRGDTQTGLPGARLPQAIRIAVRDDNGNALAGVRVRFTASPGAQIEEASPVTDAAGEAQAWLRLPMQTGTALATAEAAGRVVTFSALSAASTLSAFPRFLQTATPAGDALLAASSSILRYLQNRAEAAAPNGSAEPAALGNFLRDFCQTDTGGNQVCDGYVSAPGSASGAAGRWVNLWRLAAFAGGNLDIAPVETTPASIRDRLAEGTPVLLALSVPASAGPAEAVAHFVVGIGVSASGGILIHDPNPALARQTLDEYLNNRATLTGAVRLLPRAPSVIGFLVMTSSGATSIESAGGNCGFSLQWPDAAGRIRFLYCEGLQASYQLSLETAFILTDLGNAGPRSESAVQGPAAFRINRSSTGWGASALQLTYEEAAVVNAASFTNRLSPGALLAVFGSGLAAKGQATSVEIGGIPATLLLATPFQINSRVPPELAIGRHVIRIVSPFGSLERSLEVAPVAPALFSLQNNRGAVLNQNGTLNTPENPARRGEVIVVYGTGFGALRAQGNLLVAETPLQGSLEGQVLETLFAGEAPGFPGLNQANLRVPSALPPGLGLRLTIQQAGIASNAVFIAVQ